MVKVKKKRRVKRIGGLKVEELKFHELATGFVLDFGRERLTNARNVLAGAKAIESAYLVEVIDEVLANKFPANDRIIHLAMSLAMIKVVALEEKYIKVPKVGVRVKSLRKKGSRQLEMSFV
jgi:hypothetical protein